MTMKAKRSRIRKHPVQAEHETLGQLKLHTAHMTPGEIREFESGATRDTDEGKPDYAGFMDPATVKRFGQYMHEHRFQKDGTMRAADNWKKGIPRDVYIQSLFRHFIDLWDSHQVENLDEDPEYRREVEDALCAIMFNAQGYLYEFLCGR